MYYQWLQLHHPTYANDWHKNAITLEPLSAEDLQTGLDPEPTTLKEPHAKVTRKGKGKAPVDGHMPNLLEVIQQCSL